MYFPLISERRKVLYPRRGGGGGGRGGGGGVSGGGGGRGGSGGGVGGGSRSVSGPTLGGRNTATAYGNGGGQPSTIGVGLPFAGRQQGGGSRNQVFGSQTYGSGYPGFAGNRGVGGLGFPFFFWPVVWGTGIGGSAAYLHSREYGNANNDTRPGGPLTEAPFTSLTMSTTMHVIADNTTTISLIESIVANCSDVINVAPNGVNITARPFDPDASGTPKPEQVVQYYRASSISLTLDGYNNTAALVEDPNAAGPDVPLPSNIDTAMLDCLNQTIGLAAPLIDGAPALLGAPGVGLSGFVLVMWALLSIV